MNTARVERPVSKANKRGAARLAAVQALYQMDVASSGLEATLAEFEAHRLGGEIEGDKLIGADVKFFRDLVSGVVKLQRRIDTDVNTHLEKGWPLKRVDLTLRAVLRAGAYELIERRDVPPRVVISEYVDIAKAFFEDGDEPGIVNAILDSIARRERAKELAGSGG
ncbi:transcription antitermination factor NusB [Microbaculum marinisediminis]|uniref:Transcription antitermination protein NusB n=1 Tax=Microbaculum marinisediminis TaxID=2931392 RepID=A0AAW5R3C9_9HYPH|nr:transcription antitermination factor NusB [Microbaculum sp. A6E488]MCT8973040.1 transcription antitermination factor NusB [Microbaculum sp. A6E488]